MNEADWIVYALRLYKEYGDGAEAEAQRRMDEAYNRSHSDWVMWLTIRNALRQFMQPRP